jgi:hypothetical protein
MLKVLAVAIMINTSTSRRRIFAKSMIAQMESRHWGYLPSDKFQIQFI